jgi:hypothetical protein
MIIISLRSFKLTFNPKDRCSFDNEAIKGFRIHSEIGGMWVKITAKMV